jgi:sterol 3beta-glucosyltransferase
LNKSAAKQDCLSENFVIPSNGLLSSIPQVVAPFTTDQPLWGSRIHAIGVGPKPIRASQLSVEGMVSAMPEAGSKIVLERAQATGQIIRGEDGVGEAARMIESYAMEFGESV